MKPEVGNATLGLCVDGLLSRPDASDGLKGSRTGRQHAVGLGPQPRPVGIPEVDEFCFALGGGRFRSSGIHFLYFTVDHYRKACYHGGRCKLTKQIGFTPSK